ncbi:MAG: site-2 protease family protein [Planctomycetaceae bacterium]
MQPPPSFAGPDLETLLRSRRSSRLRLQALLYILTCLTTFAAGAVGWQPLVLGFDEIGPDLAAHWQRGLIYAAAVMAVLTAHEAGHFIAAWIHGIPATLPFFIPVPVLLTGTLGAVIGMEGARANRRQLFDIAVAGPIAGLAVAVPLLAVGLFSGGGPDPEAPFAMPPLARWVQAAVRPDLPGDAVVAPNAAFMAGWVGLLVTGLNLIPMSQLDGGHVCRAVFGHAGNWVARVVLVTSMAAVIVTGQFNWVLMLVLVTLMGVDHPPIADDGRSLGPLRTVIGLAVLVIPILTFMPEPLRLE